MSFRKSKGTDGIVQWLQISAKPHYSVKTAKRVYNAVSGPQTFRETRQIWQDDTPVVEALVWVPKTQGWKEANKDQFEP